MGCGAGVEGDSPKAVATERKKRFSDYAVLYRGNHQARVFIVGTEKGLPPPRGRPASDEDEAPDAQATRVEEERWLMYVAVTRAQRSPTLTWCKARKRAKDVMKQIPSRFLTEMNLDAVPPSRTTDGAAAKAKLSALRAMLAPKPSG